MSSHGRVGFSTDPPIQNTPDDPVQTLDDVLNVKNRQSSVDTPRRFPVDTSSRLHAADSGTQTPAGHAPITPPLRPFSDVLSIASSQNEDHTGKSWASHVAHNPLGQTDPWIPLILTLDGGGIRGYSSLLIVMELMRQVAKWETYYENMEARPGDEKRIFDPLTLLPCHYFDFMYGTSTGGLIATLLGRLRMTVPECLDIYKVVGNELFGKKKKKSILPGATKYDHVPLEKRVRQIVADNCPRLHYHADGKCKGDDWHPWYLDPAGNEPEDHEPFHRDTSDRLCHSILLTAIHNNREEAYLLRSYDHQYSEKPEFITEYNAGAEKMRIWEATRATSAAPFFFKSLILDIDGERKEFKDGGIRENNPAGAAWSEFMSLYGRGAEHTILRAEPTLLLSIGTGRPNMDNDGFAETWPGPFGHVGLVRKIAEIFSLVKHMRIKYTSGEKQHDVLVQQAQGMHSWYKRLNVDTGMEYMRLDNWESGPELDPLTGEFVTSPSKEHHHHHHHHNHHQQQEDQPHPNHTGENKSNPSTRYNIIPGGKTLSTIYEVTTAYLSRETRIEALKEYAPPQVMLSQAAQKLVLHRREREKAARSAADSDLDRLRWDNFLGKNL